MDRKRDENKLPSDDNACMEIFHWVDVHPTDPYPPLAVRGGYDQDGVHIFVGRVHRRGAIYTANVRPAVSKAFYLHDGHEHETDQFQALVGVTFKWIWYDNSSSDQEWPKNAVQCGATSTGEPIHIGRGVHETCLLVGSAYKSHGALFIPFQGREVKLTKFQILIKYEP